MATDTARILDFKTRFPGVDYRRFVAGHLADYIRKTGELIRIGDPGAPVGAVDAFVGAADLKGARGWQGRWLALCPCGGAEVVAEGQPFMCCSCFNRENDYQWMSVRFPKQRTEIEALLTKRPGRNRNWLAHETTADLRAENTEHGIRG